MTCDATKAELVGYHLGALDLAGREAVDAHLLECRACLSRYLSVKRALEDGLFPDEAPSELTRARVRAGVAAIVAPRAKSLRPAWVLGAAAAAAAIFLFAFELGAGKVRLQHEPSPPAGATPLIDASSADSSLRVL